MGSFGYLVAAGLGLAGGFAWARQRAGQLSAPSPTAAGDGDIQVAETMQRLVHVARIRHGSAADVRRLVEERFPVTALYEPGIRGLSTFVGSTYVLTEYRFAGEFSTVFSAFRANPAVAEYLQELGQLLDDEPAPLPDTPGHQYLASQALHWDSAAGLSFTPRVRDKAQSGGGP